MRRRLRSFAASWLLNALLRIFAMSIITPKRKVLRMSVQDCWRPPLLNRVEALLDYFRDIGRIVRAAEGRKANDSHADCYQYFCVPEYGTANGRLHFHAVHFMRTLPTG